MSIEWYTSFVFFFLKVQTILNPYKLKYIGNLITYLLRRLLEYLVVLVIETDLAQQPLLGSYEIPNLPHPFSLLKLCGNFEVVESVRDLKFKLLLVLVYYIFELFHLGMVLLFQSLEILKLFVERHILFNFHLLVGGLLEWGHIYYIFWQLNLSLV